MDLAALISSFATAASYTVTRTARGSTTRGRIEAGTTSTITIVASVTPTGPSDLVRLPEGRQVRDTRMVITSTELLVGGQGTAYEADRIVIDSKTYEVSDVQHWVDPRSRTSAYRCLVVNV